MNIQYFEQEKLFKLDTPKTSYVFGIAGKRGYLVHLYYGPRLDSLQGIWDLARVGENPALADANTKDELSYVDCMPVEYSTDGLGDFRESSICVQDEGGHRALDCGYVSHEILRGKEKLPGLPATFGTEEEVSSLIVTCKDPDNGVVLRLKYSAFQDVDVITRSVEVINEGKGSVYLKKAMSLSLDMDNREFDAITLHGSWGREKHILRRKLELGSYRTEGKKGGNCHQAHPFLAVLSQNADETSGEVYGFSFVYSGNFLAQAEVSQFNSLRVVMGIHPEQFSWKMSPGESFHTPEVVMTYSAEGLGQMTRNFHDVYRSHLMRSPYLHTKRPVLINNWEGTYFDFDEKKILNIAKSAHSLGIEMLVLDDGWFGNRFDDNRALGDWYVNTEKLKGGLEYLVSEINKLGMKFGLWFEPEMVCPDSDLYRAHPDWAIQIPGRVGRRARNQYVLDISRKEVRDAIMEQVFKVLHSANIEYVKWDMNRPLSDLGSFALESDRQGELYHRYVLGLYEMQEALLQEFPNLLLENCSSGGGRFDPGMLYFSPQIWTSDDTDAIERLSIQEGTALIYPLSSMGAHVSVCPNHIVGRVTPLSTRGNVALTGTFGYELDTTKFGEEEITIVPRQIEVYHRFNDIIREGDYYRIASYQQNKEYDCYQVNTKKKDKALVFFTQVLNEANQKSRIVKLQGLKPEATYRLYQVTVEDEEIVKDTGKLLSGQVVMQGGISIDRPWGDFKSLLYYLEETID